MDLDNANSVDNSTDDDNLYFQTETSEGEGPSESWISARSPQSSAVSSLTSHIVDISKEVQGWQRHITLADFTKNLDSALTGVFPNQNRSRYSRVFVLLMRWQIEDPKLPVAVEIEELRRVFEEVFHFDVEVFEIPASESHIKVTQKILEFVLRNGNSKDDLKIFYYGGHSSLTRSKDLLFSSYRGIGHSGHFEKDETVTWNGIQTTLEQGLSDVLVLLDCCASGTVRIGDGHGVTELISACNYEAVANGVGIYSFTHHLITELKLLSSKKARFTAADLWAHIYHRMQSYIPKGIKNERYPAPVHYFITEDSNFPRSIEISPFSISPQLSVTDSHTNSAQTTAQPQSKRSLSDFTGAHQAKKQCISSSSKLLTSCDSLEQDENASMNQTRSRTMLFSVRLEETFSTRDLVLEAFIEWCRNIPISACEIKVEAQFESDSTILIIRAPLPLWTCLKEHLAITTIGPVKSSNMLATSITANRPIVGKGSFSRTDQSSSQNKGEPTSTFRGMTWDSGIAMKVDPDDWRPMSQCSSESDGETIRDPADGSDVAYEGFDKDQNKSQKRPRRINWAAELQPLARPRRYACPFQKHDESSASTCAFPTMINPDGGFKNFHRVKCHILRHDQAQRCKKCWRFFLTEEEATQHSLEAICTVSPINIAWMTAEQKHSFKHSKFEGTNDEKWYQLFEALFPDELEIKRTLGQSIPSPYYELAFTFPQASQYQTGSSLPVTPEVGQGFTHTFPSEDDGRSGVTLLNSEPNSYSSSSSADQVADEAKEYGLGIWSSR